MLKKLVYMGKEIGKNAQASVMAAESLAPHSHAAYAIGRYCIVETCRFSIFFCGCKQPKSVHILNRVQSYDLFLSQANWMMKKMRTRREMGEDEMQIRQANFIKFLPFYASHLNLLFLRLGGKLEVNLR